MIVGIDTSPLFEPLKVRGKVLRNRIVMPPMVAGRDIAGPEGREWYGRRARGGVGLVIVQATYAAEFGSRLTVENMRLLADAIHAGGALVALQAFPDARGWSISPAELTAADIEAMAGQYRTAAEMCASAGFDGIEPHGAHGYVLNKFFSPVQNRRADGYGGGIEGRMRLALRLVDALRPAADGAGMLILYRHTPVGDGYGIEDSLVLAGELVKRGVDILDISPASDAAPGDRAAPFRRFGVPVIAVNRLDSVDRALEVLNEGRADLVAVGRGLIADPDWPLKVREGRVGDIVACTDCNNCFADLYRGAPVGCVQWKEGREP